MPAMDGYEFVHQLRGDPAIAQTPVIFHTAAWSMERGRWPSMRRLVHLAETCRPDEVFAVVDQALGLSPSSYPIPSKDFDREHLRLVTNKLSENSEESGVRPQHSRNGLVSWPC